MTIHLVSVVECNGQVVARARAEADQARIHIEVRFTPPPGASRAELWRRARDEVLRYLDRE